jgi:GTP cyclohydrolase I
MIHMSKHSTAIRETMDTPSVRELESVRDIDTHLQSWTNHAGTSQPSSQDEIASSMRTVLSALGEDPDREGLLKTPSRVARALSFLTGGYAEDGATVLTQALFTVDCDELVLVRDIEVFSMCEHHMLPFFGKVHVAYLPKGKVVGLSKIPRLVDVFARRLQVQERLTRQIAQKLFDVVQPAGVAVVMEAEHLCMKMRGVQRQNSVTTTSCMLGEFRTQAKLREEFYGLIRPA